MLGFFALIACFFLYLAQRDLAKRLRRAEAALAQAGLIAEPAKTDRPTDIIDPTAHGTHDPAVPGAAGGTPASGVATARDGSSDPSAAAPAGGARNSGVADASIVDEARAAFDRASAAPARPGAAPHQAQPPRAHRPGRTPPRRVRPHPTP